MGKIVDHLWGHQTASALAEARERLGAIDVDRLRVKPIVKVTGEFFAQTTEGDGNFRMFQFLEREGAEVTIEPIANWIMYLLWQTKARRADRKWLDMTKPPAWRVHARLACEMRFRQASVAAHRRRADVRAPLPPRGRRSRRHRP